MVNLVYGHRNDDTLFDFIVSPNDVRTSRRHSIFQLPFFSYSYELGYKCGNGMEENKRIIQ